MELSRFYCERISESMAELSPSEAHHLADVMRIGKGGCVEVFDGAGIVAQAVVERIEKQAVVLTVERRMVHKQRDIGRIVLAVSVAKGERFDRLISKCTELGVDRIVPVVFERTVKLARGLRVVERWNRLAISAAKQCRRIFLPVIYQPGAVEDVVRVLKTDFPQGRFIVGSLSHDASSILDMKARDSDVIAFVGPEGGFTNAEQEFLHEAGCASVRLTDTVLRVETAGIAMAAVLCVLRDANR